MDSSNKILLVDDHIGDITWLTDYLENKGYEVDHLTNEEAAVHRLEAIQRKEIAYRLAIIDIMVSVKDIMDLATLRDEFYEESERSGTRLCEYARRKLRIPADQLPIVCISARADSDDIQKELTELGIQLFSRVPQTSEESLRSYLDKNLTPA